MMTEEEELKLPANVILIDVAYLNFMIGDMKRYFERKLNRTLQQIDLALFIEYLAMDVKYQVGDNETQVLLIYNNENTKIVNTKPSDISNELDGMAFSGDLGEFIFAGVPCEDMVTIDELVLDILRVVIDSTEVQRIIVLAADKSYDAEVIDLLDTVENKEVIQYRMNESTDRISYHWELLVFPVMQALGIQPDEI